MMRYGMRAGLTGLLVGVLSAVGHEGRVETVTHRVVRERDSRIEALSMAELRHHEDRVEVTELWRPVGGSEVRFEVTFARDTYRPMHWVRTTQEGPTTVRTEVAIEGDELVSRHYRDGTAVGRDSVGLPDGLFTVPPLVKIVLPHVMRGANPPDGFFHVLVNDDGSMRVVSLTIGVHEEESMVVPAGTFRCRRVTINPASRAVALIVPPAQVFLPVEGPAVMVRTSMRQTRLGALNATELTSYESTEP